MCYAVTEMKQTLLQKFINEKIDNYVEPERKGTPKGDPIGFSKVKYEASLAMLYNYSQKWIAENLGVSYGLLRKWNTEENFKKLIENHMAEFARLYHNRFSSVLKEFIKLARNFADDSFNKPAVELLKTKFESPKIDDFADQHYYSPALWEKIKNRSIDLNDDETDPERNPLDHLYLRISQSEFINILFFPPFDKYVAENGESKRVIPKSVINIKHELINAIKIILFKKDLSDEDKKAIFIALLQLEILGRKWE